MEIICVFFKNNSIYFFLWRCWVFGALRAPLHLQCAGFSLLLQSTGSRACEGCSICRMWAQWLRCMGLAAPWHLSRPEFKPISPVWAGGFFTTEAPGKPGNYTEERKKKEKRTKSCLAGPTVTNADNWWVPHGGQNAVTRGVDTPPRRAQVSLARQGGALTWRTDSGCGELVAQ